MNNHANYPKDLKTFEKNKAKYVAMWKKIKGKVKTGLSTEQQFIINFSTAFNDGTANVKDSQRPIASSKLMQLDFLAQVFGMGEKKNNELFTNMAFLAQKKGQGFGPFGKLF